MTVVVPGRRIVQGVVDCSPDLLLASHSLVDPPMASVVKGVRQALGADVRILVLYGFDPQGVPTEVDDVQRAEPLQPTELSIRVSRMLQELAERRVLQKKNSELLGLYKMSWAFSLAGGADALYRRTCRATAPSMLKAERGLVMLYDNERRQLVGQVPGVRAHARAGEARALLGRRRGRLALELPQERPAAVEQGAGRHAPLPDVSGELALQSLMIAPDHARARRSWGCWRSPTAWAARPSRTRT